MVLSPDRHDRFALSFRWLRIAAISLQKFAHIRKKHYLCARIQYLETSILSFCKKFNKQNLQIMAYKISSDCVACGTCIDECPMGAISEGDQYSIDADVCTECGTCADVCPSGAISL